MAITGRAALLAASAALLVGLLVPSWNGVLAVQLVLLFAILYDLARAAPVRPLAFTRSDDTIVRLDESASVELSITNPSDRPLRALVRDAWPPSTHARTLDNASARQRLTVPAGERRRLTTVLTPSRRGDHHADRVTVRSYGPLGLAARQASHAVPSKLRVLPAFPSRRHLPGKLARLRELDGRMSALTRGEGTEFDSLREYVPGDDTRSIDWRASARQSLIAVRTWRPERDRRIQLVLDTGRTAAGRVGDVPRLDVYMDAALLLSAVALRAGDHVDLVAYDRRTRATVQGRSGPSALADIVSALAPVEAQLVESDPRGLVSAALTGSRRRSLVVLFTGLDAAPVEEGLLPLIPQLTSRHTVLVAAVADPAIEEMAGGRGTVEAVYGAAAAEQSRQERRLVAEQLQRHGAVVVDAEPDHLASRLTDTYLSLKAAGRL
ncbi:DUF58 domain-containing protein [Streptomyces durbertensis]|uniref:DUF58 domain-containing protein n=1 Tax=Streptomyces durbertensis TaxID=2448886 RepID=A0ABR6EG72_9ACTN|nr:DUF58 domain-containing protein [Streptomyces durbertensis]MBB1244338.1 DUF58 domain-containing protein [Streptomyces durbertensis]